MSVLNRININKKINKRKILLERRVNIKLICYITDMTLTVYLFIYLHLFCSIIHYILCFRLFLRIEFYVLAEKNLIKLKRSIL